MTRYEVHTKTLDCGCKMSWDVHHTGKDACNNYVCVTIVDDCTLDHNDDIREVDDDN